MGTRSVTDGILEPSGLAAADEDLATIERLVPGESVMQQDPVLDRDVQLAPARVDGS